MADPLNNYYEVRLIREIEAIEARIADLRSEQDALKRQLLKARWETHALRDVNRKNSAVRVMVEERIVNALRTAKKPLPNSTLFKAAQIANFQLREGTFRTYLLRLKQRAIIESPRRGVWQLVNQSNGQRPSPPRD